MSRNTKPVISMRKPPTPATVDAFVRGDQPAISLVTAPPAPASEPSANAEQPGIVARQDGRTRRRMTVYLPPDLAQALKVQSAMSGKEMSELIADAVRAHLDR